MSPLPAPEVLSGEFTLRELLTTPYITYVEAIPADEDGVWVRKASCPELDGCFVIRPKAWDAILGLEIFLTQYLVDRVASSDPVPRPKNRAVVGDLSAEELLLRAERGEWIPKLDEPIAVLDGAGLGS